jgi:hypothetical protein
MRLENSLYDVATALIVAARVDDRCDPVLVESKHWGAAMSKRMAARSGAAILLGCTSNS